MTAAPLQIRAFRGFDNKGDIGAPKFVTVNPRYNAPSSCTIGLIGDDRMLATLMHDDAALTVRDANGDHIISGTVEDVRWQGPTAASLIEVDIHDDFNVLDEILGWVVPANAITNQGTAGTNWTMTDNAETVLKTALQLNGINRMGMPLIIGTDLGRGAVVKASLRWEPLYSKLFPVVDGAGLAEAGLGWTVRRAEDGLHIDCFEPAEYPRDLTETGGAVVDWSWTKKAATATRVVIAGPGTGTLRSVRAIDPALGGTYAALGTLSANREAAMGRIIERFRDARDVDPGDLPEMYERGRQTLVEGAATSSVSMTLANTPSFQYGVNVRVGDKVRVVLAGQVFEAVLSEALLSWTADSGWQTTPRVGERTSDTDTMLAKAIQAIVRRLAKDQRT
jgi:hypothetical protein